jgi:hypothetical protein
MLHSSVEPDGDGAGVRVEPFGGAEHDRGAAERAQLLRPAFEDRGALHEIEHAEAGGEPRRPRRRQDVVRAGDIIADRLRRVRADEDRAFTGTNPRPVRLAGTAALCGGGLDDGVLAGLDALVRDQIMAMKTTFTPGHYRRRVAGVLARRLLQRLFAG